MQSTDRRHDVLCMIASVFALACVTVTLPAQPGTPEPAYKGVLEPVGYAEDLDLLDVFFVSPDEGWVSGDAGTILHTRDGGTTWEAQVGGDPASRDDPVRLLYFFDERRGWALQGRKLLHTADGESWEEIGGLPHGASAIVFTSPSNGFLSAMADIYARMPNVIYRTVDGGRTWSAAWPCTAKVSMGGLTRELGCHITQFQFVSPLVGYATAHNNCSGAGCEPPPLIVKTTDGGESWQAVPGPGIVDEDHMSSVFFLDESSGFARLRSGKLHMTADGGETWRGIIASPGPTIRFADPEIGWGVELERPDLRWSYTTNGGRRWTSRELRLPAVTRGFSMPRRDRAYIVGDHGMVFRYSVVPASQSLGPNDKAAPAMPPFESALEAELGELEAVVAGLDAALDAPLATNTGDASASASASASAATPASFASACCAASFDHMEAVLAAISVSLPEFVERFRNLNLLAVAMRLGTTLPSEYEAVTGGLRAFRAATDKASAESALADVRAALESIRLAMKPTSATQTQEQP